VSIKSLQDIFEHNGLNEKHSLLIARYLIEPKDQKEVVFNEQLSKGQGQIIDGIRNEIGHY
jgi:hypothetical protein